MTIYECWAVPEEDQDPDEGATALTFTTPENALAMKAKGLMEPGEIPVYSVRADSWDEAMTIHHEVQGWEPYKPMP